MPENNKRIQLTLFLDEYEAEFIEIIRQKFNPEQYRLIKSHVTLCREDEIKQIDKILETLQSLSYPFLTIKFGKPLRFSEGKGVLLPTLGENEGFQNLRKSVLQKVTANPRKHEPHITLMHPRNSICTNDIFQEIKNFCLPNVFKFKKISLIEQKNGKTWTTLQEFSLKNL